MRKLVILLLLIPIISFGQDLNEESNGYMKKDIYTLKMANLQVGKIKIYVADTSIKVFS